MRNACVLATCALVATSMVAPVAGAQSASVDAGELFRQGRQALAAKDYTTACARFEASEHLERAVGTLLSLAECEEATGRLAAARLHLLDAADWAAAIHDPLNRGALARSRADALGSRVPRLTLKLTADAPKGSSASRDGLDLGATAFGAALPTDPGSHAIVVTAEGYAPKAYDVTLREGEEKTLDVSPGVSLTAPPIAADAPPPREVSPEGGHGRRTTAFVLGGVGVVLAAAGTYFGFRTISKWSDAKSDCKAGPCGQGSTAASERSDALTSSTISTIAFAAGGAAVAGALIVYLTAPSTRASNGASALGIRFAPEIAAHGAGAFVRGEF